MIELVSIGSFSNGHCLNLISVVNGKTYMNLMATLWVHLESVCSAIILSFRSVLSIQYRTRIAMPQMGLA